MSKHKMTAWAPFGLQPDALEVQIEYTFSAGRPAVMYLRNGDPGYPADPAEADLISVKCVHPLNDAMQKMLDEWAGEYLGTEGYEDAIENARDDGERDYDRALDAYERRRTGE